MNASRKDFEILVEIKDDYVAFLKNKNFATLYHKIPSNFQLKTTKNLNDIISDGIDWTLQLLYSDYYKNYRVDKMICSKVSQHFLIKFNKMNKARYEQAKKIQT